MQMRTWKGVAQGIWGFIIRHMLSLYVCAIQVQGIVVMMDPLSYMIVAFIPVIAYWILYLMMRRDVKLSKWEKESMMARMDSLEKQLTNYENAYPPHWKKERPNITTRPADDATVPSSVDPMSRALNAIMREHMRRSLERGTNRE